MIWILDNAVNEVAKYFNVQPILVLNQKIDNLSFWKIYGVEFQISQWDGNYREVTNHSAYVATSTESHGVFLVQGSDGGGTFCLHFWNLHKIWI